MHYSGYHVCTDGSLTPAEILVTNYLIRTYGETARKILEKHGMQEIADYCKHSDDGHDAFRIKVRPDNYDKIREVLLELAAVSKEHYDRDVIEEEKREKIRSDATDLFEKVFADIDKLVGEDLG